MDKPAGVGLFIFCNSMRVIRNPSDDKPNSFKRYNSSFWIDIGISKFLVALRFLSYLKISINVLCLSDLRHFPRNFFKAIKKSSILLMIGCIRHILVQISNYNYSSEDYGLQWNFFFTLFFVRVRLLI